MKTSMTRRVTNLGIIVVSAALVAACGTSAGSEATPRSAVTNEKPAGQSENESTPDLSRGIDQSQFHNPAYQEKLSSVTEKLHAVLWEISAKLGDNPNFVNLGAMPGEEQVVVYWSGPTDDPALSQARKIAREKGVSAIVAPRKVSRGGLEEAQSQVEKNRLRYRELGVYISSYGGFAADFDGIKVDIDSEKSTNKDLAAIQRMIESDVHVPIHVTIGGFVY